MKKNMKFLIAITALSPALFISNNLFAQSNDNANLTVTLNSVSEIKVNAAQEEVGFIYSTAADYQSGVSSVNADHLEVTSTVDFQVTAAAGTDLIGVGAISSSSIPVSTISITASAGTSGAVGTYAPIASLSTLVQPLITSGLNGGTAGGTALGKYDVTYVSSGGTHYVNKPTGEYKSTVTYTLTPL